MASDPFLPKRTISAHGTISTIFLRDLHLDRMRQGKDHALFELRPDRGHDVRIVVTQSHGGEAVDEVDVFVAVHVPDTTTLGTLDEVRRHAVRILGLALAEGLASERDGALGTFQHLLRTLITVRHNQLAFSFLWSAACTTSFANDRWYPSFRSYAVLSVLSSGRRSSKARISSVLKSGLAG